MNHYLQPVRSPVDGVRIWQAQLDSFARKEIAELLAPLSAAERERAARFHFERDRNNFIAARGLLRCLLGEILHEPAASLVFEYGARGKPALANMPQIHFNLSHSSGWAIYAMADREVGIDLENGARLDQDEEDLARLAGRILSRRELDFWRAVPSSTERRALFLRAWTRKEAYAKATGRGVFDSFAAIEVIPEMENALTSEWSLHDFEAPAGFAAALAVRRSGERKVVEAGASVFAQSSNA